MLIVCLVCNITNRPHETRFSCYVVHISVRYCIGCIAPPIGSESILVIRWGMIIRAGTFNRG